MRLLHFHCRIKPISRNRHRNPRISQAKRRASLYLRSLRQVKGVVWWQERPEEGEEGESLLRRD